MVRVVCDTYQHISAFGDFEIYDDGRLNVEWNGTSIPHEAAGVLKADDAKIPQNAETSDADFSQIDKILDRGRWRFSAMLGHLGDMIRLMVTEPTQELGKLAENAFRSGRAHVNVGSDGRVLVQSTDEIALERVCRIRVPIRLKDRRDGGGVMPDDFKTLEQSFTQQWDDVNGGFGPDTLMYQLRVYSRWFSQYSCLAHIHQLSQAEAENKPGPEWKLPLESETPDPKTNAGLPDRPPGFLYRHAYATIRILKDGCIVLWSHDGNSIEMTSEGIRLASVKHLDLEAAGDIRLHAGQSVCVHSRNTAYIESAEGFISTLSHCGTQIHSKGDVDIISESAPTRTKTPEGEEEPEVPEALPVDADRPKKNEKYGVRIQARTASLNVQTLTDVTMMGDNFTFVGNPEHGAIRMTTAHATTNAKFLQLGNLRLEGTNASFIGLVQSTSLQANSAKILYLSSTYVGSVYGFSGGSSRFVSPNAGMGAVELDVLTLPSEELPEPPYEIDPDPNKGGSRIPSNISARLVGPRFESLAQQYIRMDLQADDAAGKARNSFGRYKPFNYRLGLSESPYGHTIKTEITGFTDAIPSLRQPGDLPLDPTFKTSLRGEFTPTKSDTLFYWSREEPAP
jgi:hypothetical protein